MPSGNIGYEELQFDNIGVIEKVEPILAPLLSTERTMCQAGVAGLTRFEKIKYIFDTDPESQLNVCVMKASKRNDDFLNCGKCWKCVKTLYDIEAMGKLKEVEQIFEINDVFSFFIGI